MIPTLASSVTESRTLGVVSDCLYFISIWSSKFGAGKRILGPTHPHHPSLRRPFSTFHPVAGSTDPPYPYRTPFVLTSTSTAARSTWAARTSNKARTILAFSPPPILSAVMYLPFHVTSCSRSQSGAVFTVRQLDYVPFGPVVTKPARIHKPPPLFRHPILRDLGRPCRFRDTNSLMHVQQMKTLEQAAT